MPDTIDLARLLAVSHGMRDAVAATGREVKETNQFDATRLGYLSTLKHLDSRGRLSHREYLCEAAARSGQLEELKALRLNDWPWGMRTALRAAKAGHLDVMQWARANGCPWNAGACRLAADRGHLETLKWARANGCPWTASTRDKAASLGYIENDGSSCEPSSDDNAEYSSSDDADDTDDGTAE